MCTALIVAALLTQTTAQPPGRRRKARRRDVGHPAIVSHRGMASPDGTYRATTKTDDVSETTQLTAAATGRCLAVGEVARLWRDDVAFAAWFQSLLASSSFEAYFWEVPPVNSATFARTPYEHTLVRNRWGFQPADSSDFAQHLEGACARGESCVAFPNLGRDAMLVAPCDQAGPPPARARDHGTLYERSRGPVDAESAYGHLGAFARGASPAQAAAFWARVGATYEALAAQRAERPVWLSTEGSGVPWLHVRLDSRPKYYHTGHYRVWGG